MAAAIDLRCGRQVMLVSRRPAPALTGTPVSMLLDYLFFPAALRSCRYGLECRTGGYRVPAEATVA
jgi:hypothetical protein